MGQSTSGRKIFRRWRLGDWEYRSDLISHDYMRRWMLKTPWFMLRLHHILRGDADGEFHDHPMDFVSLILSGGYVEHELSTCGEQISPRLPGQLVFRRAEDLHWLELAPGRTAWTLLLTGPFRRQWGFSTEDGWVPASEYDAWKARRAARQPPPPLDGPPSESAS